MNEEQREALRKLLPEGQLGVKSGKQPKQTRISKYSKPKGWSKYPSLLSKSSINQFVIIIDSPATDLTPPQLTEPQQASLLESKFEQCEALLAIQLSNLDLEDIPPFDQLFISEADNNNNNSNTPPPPPPAFSLPPPASSDSDGNRDSDNNNTSIMKRRAQYHPSDGTQYALDHSEEDPWSQYAAHYTGTAAPVDDDANNGGDDEGGGRDQDENGLNIDHAASGSATATTDNLPPGLPSWYYTLSNNNKSQGQPSQKKQQQQQSQSQKQKKQQSQRLVSQDEITKEDSLIAAACPWHDLRHINRTFKTQQDAFEYADGINKQLDLIAERKPVIMAVITNNNNEIDGDRRFSSSTSGHGLVGGHNAQREEEGGNAVVANTTNAFLQPRTFLNRGATYTGTNKESSTANNSLSQNNRDGIRKPNIKSRPSQAVLAAYEALNSTIEAAKSELENQQERKQQQGDIHTASYDVQAHSKNNKQQVQQHHSPPPPPEEEPKLPQLHDQAVRVFCVEKPIYKKNSDGMSNNHNDPPGYYRSFVAASITSLWREFRCTPPPKRHWYEVIREGHPCHLYFDIEFQQDINPGVDGHSRVSKLIDRVIQCFTACFPSLTEHSPLLPEHVWELDSTVGVGGKFSRHLVIRHPKVAWVNNITVGQFVKKVLSSYGDEFLINTPLPAGISNANNGYINQPRQAMSSDNSGGVGFMHVDGNSNNININNNIQDEGPPPEDLPMRRTSMVDTAVYSRNRHFRLPYCSKGGKSAVLRPVMRGALLANTAAAAGATQTRASPGAVLLASLITRVDDDVALISMSPADVAAGIKPFLVVAHRHGAGIYTTSNTDTVTGGTTSAGHHHHHYHYHNNTVRVVWKKDSRDGPMNPDKAKELEHLALAAAPIIARAASDRSSGMDIFIRSITICGQHGNVSYGLGGGGAHYCGNIGSCHKSNFAYYIANLNNGGYAQRCYDPDCGGYRSEWMPLPREVCLTSEDGNGGGSGSEMSGSRGAAVGVGMAGSEEGRG
jgi:hypothetical protein